MPLLAEMCKEGAVAMLGRAAFCRTPPARSLARAGANAGNAAVPEGRGRRLRAGGRDTAPPGPEGQPALPSLRSARVLASPTEGCSPERRACPPAAPEPPERCPWSWRGRSSISPPVAIEALRPRFLLATPRVRCETTAAPAAGSVRGSLRSGICRAEPGWVYPLVERRGVVSVWGSCIGCTGIPGDPAQFQALILRAFPWAAEGTIGLSQTVWQDEERRRIYLKG